MDIAAYSRRLAELRIFYNTSQRHNNPQPCLFSDTCFNTRQFTSFQGLWNHLTDYHHEELKLIKQFEKPDSVPIADEWGENMWGLDNLDADNSEDDSIELLQDTSNRPLQFNSFVEELVIRVTEIKDLHKFSDSGTNTLVTAVLDTARKWTSDIKTKPLFDEAMRYASSRKLQMGLIESLETYVKPKIMPLGEVEEGFLYANIESTVKVMLNDPYLVESIVKEQNGDIHEVNHHYLMACSEEKRSRMIGKLRLELNLDDFRIDHSKGKCPDHLKLLGVYISNSNLPLEHRSNNDDLFTVALATRDVLKSIDTHVEPRKGIMELMKFIKDELNYLILNGIRVEYCGEEIRIDVFFAQLIGDNLGMDEVLRLSMCYSSGEICRTCHATYDQIQLLPYADYELRERYDSPLSNIMGITVAELNRNDPFHLFHEGIIPKYFPFVIRDLGVTAAQINEAMDKIIYIHGQVKSFPPDRKFELKGTAMQKFEFFSRFNELMLHLPTLDRSRPGFQFYFSLRNLIRISLSKAVPDPGELIQSVRNFHRECFNLIQQNLDVVPPLKLIPKVHYCSHIPSDTASNGPLIYGSTLRYERKHKFFTLWAERMFNFKNPLLTLMQRHQRHMAVSWDKRIRSNFLVHKPLEMSHNFEFGIDALSRLHRADSHIKTSKNILRRFSENHWIEPVEIKIDPADNIKKVFGPVWTFEQGQAEIDLGIQLHQVARQPCVFLEEKALNGTNDFLVEYLGYSFVNIIANPFIPEYLY